MELWALRPHAILAKVISVCRLLVFFHQYAADLREEGSENVLRRVSASPFIFDVTVSSTSGVITAPPEDLAREVLPLFTGVNILYGVNTSTPFVVPPALDIEWSVMQLHDFLNYRTPETRLSSLLISLSAFSSTLTLPRNQAKFSSSSFSLEHLQPPRGKISPPTGEALLPPPADDCLIPCLDDTNTVVQCETFPGSEYPSSLPACATVRAMLSAGPSDASDWVGYQDLYDAAGGIIDLCNARDPGEGRGIAVGTAELSVQILRVRRSAVFRWKPGIRIGTSSYSALRQLRMSGVVPSPILTCRSRLDLDYCCSPLELDGDPYDLMIEFVGDWYLALTFHAGGQN